MWFDGAYLKTDKLIIETANVGHANTVTENDIERAGKFTADLAGRASKLEQLCG